MDRSPLRVTLPPGLRRSLRRWHEVDRELQDTDNERRRAALRALRDVLSKEIVRSLDLALGGGDV